MCNRNPFAYFFSIILKTLVKDMVRCSLSMAEIIHEKSLRLDDK